MGSRHSFDSNDAKSIVNRLQELFLANSGEDPFEELYKLVVAKIFLETNGDMDSEYLAQGVNNREFVESVLRKANHKWPNIVQGTCEIKMTNEHLDVFLREMQDISFSGSNFEIIDSFFESIVASTSKGAKGQYFTPRHVVECLVRIINPRPGELICDPACGSGGFLIHAVEHLKNKADISDIKKCVYGFDFDKKAVSVCRALMILAGCGTTNFHQINSLLKPSAGLIPTEEYYGYNIEDALNSSTNGFSGFDVIITNPPFAGEIKEPHILNSYSLASRKKRVERDALFLERCVNLLKPGGRIAIVLPVNKFSTKTWGYLREWLIRNVEVKAVLGLGRSAFMPYTSQKTNVLFAKKRLKPIKFSDALSEEVHFFLSEMSGKDNKGNFIIKAQDAETLWDRVDHDLADVVTMTEGLWR
ncbi:putative type I restriction enzymeP M protein [Pseudodesulfovibrio hydrargyri]|uniref:Putative type I restriction enzymeP M protein n=1 Tax=Pseudodesulfovibrio hydrargyri TaxID=2125990 RepID=A0A1J5NFR4_9BACT|nr:N-6 DNA methylase [Pseudodesulfovibrio hydrargyri]OIQ50553.1 putative type I restriction enzymeP M protein [Pseudodesulfovibrio hydrargyri]